MLQTLILQSNKLEGPLKPLNYFWNCSYGPQFRIEAG